MKIRVMNHRQGVVDFDKAILVDSLDQALAMIHELAPVFWDRDGVRLDDHVLDFITIGLWNPLETHDGSHGCVVVHPSPGGVYQIVFTGDLVWVRETDRRPILEMVPDNRKVI